MDRARRLGTIYAAATDLYESVTLEVLKAELSRRQRNAALERRCSRDAQLTSARPRPMPRVGRRVFAGATFIAAGLSNSSQ